MGPTIRRYHACRMSATRLSDVFQTLPRPRLNEEIRGLGRELDGTRRELMLGRSWGLTTTYNHVHDPDDHDPAVVQLRDVHVAIDEAVMRAYGWGDLELKDRASPDEDRDALDGRQGGAVRVAGPAAGGEPAPLQAGEPVTQTPRPIHSLSVARLPTKFAMSSSRC